jgi:hypothetical protein
MAFTILCVLSFLMKEIHFQAEFFTFAADEIWRALDHQISLTRFFECDPVHPFKIEAIEN